MKLLIDIPEEEYELVRHENKSYRTELVLMNAVAEGTPLPEHHGRLIDADWVKNTLDIYVINEYNGQFIRRNDIDTIPTIIEGSEANAT